MSFETLTKTLGVLVAILWVVALGVFSLFLVRLVAANI